MRDAVNVAVVRSFVETFQRGDLESMIDTLDPAVEVNEWPDGPEARTYRGHEGIRELELTITSTNVFTVGDSKIVRVQLFTDREAALAAVQA